MRGYPKFLNTKEDYLYVHENFPREQWLPDFQALLDGMTMWVQTAELESEDEGVVDATHKVIPGQDSTGKQIWAQMELRDNPDCKLLRIGFTKEEVENLMAE